MIETIEGENIDTAVEVALTEPRAGAAASVDPGADEVAEPGSRQE